jgi:hypothetical protein
MRPRHVSWHRPSPVHLQSTALQQLDPRTRSAPRHRRPLRSRARGLFLGRSDSCPRDRQRDWLRPGRRNRSRCPVRHTHIHPNINDAPLSARPRKGPRILPCRGRGPPRTRLRRIERSHIGSERDKSVACSRAAITSLREGHNAQGHRCLPYEPSCGMESPLPASTPRSAASNMANHELM